MRSYEFITERFVNLVHDQEKKQQYLDQVWDVLEKSYQYAGGLKIGGLNNPEDLMRIPFWKLVVKDGTVHGVVLYKDKSGRKSIAAGTDGSSYGKRKVAEIMIDDLTQGRSYSEKSKASLGFVLKQVPKEIWSLIFKTPEQAEQILGKNVTPLTSLPEAKWPEDAKVTVSKYPELLEYGYIRQLGSGVDAFKIMMGTPYQKIY